MKISETRNSVYRKSRICKFIPPILIVQVFLNGVERQLWCSNIFAISLSVAFLRENEVESGNYIAYNNGQQLYFRSPTRRACGKENFQLFRLERSGIIRMCL